MQCSTHCQGTVNTSQRKCFTLTTHMWEGLWTETKTQKGNGDIRKWPLHERTGTGGSGAYLTHLVNNLESFTPICMSWIWICSWEGCVQGRYVRVAHTCLQWWLYAEMWWSMDHTMSSETISDVLRKTFLSYLLTSWGLLRTSWQAPSLFFWCEWTADNQPCLPEMFVLPITFGQVM